jgi:glycerophosphoryl diester phosphodiesterase
MDYQLNSLIGSIVLLASFVILGLLIVFYFVYRLPRLPYHSTASLWSWSSITIGHRGCRVASLDIPENSLLAFHYAQSSGSDGIEIDVQLTADNEIVIFHDNPVDRLLQGEGIVSELTFREIQAMKFKRISTATGEYDVPSDLTDEMEELWLPGHILRVDRVPSLEQVILYCQAKNLRLMIESKEWRKPELIRQKLIQLFDKYSMHSWSYIASFNPFHLYWIRHLRPEIPVSLLYCRGCIEWYHDERSQEMKLPNFCDKKSVRWILDQMLLYSAPKLLPFWIGCSIIGPEDKVVNLDLITNMRQKGVVINVWTVNTNGMKQYLQENGCTITTDILFNTEQDAEQRSDSHLKLLQLREEGEKNYYNRASI